MRYPPTLDHSDARVPLGNDTFTSVFQRSDGNNSVISRNPHFRTHPDISSIAPRPERVCGIRLTLESWRRSYMKCGDLEEMCVSFRQSIRKQISSSFPNWSIIHVSTFCRTQRSVMGICVVLRMPEKLRFHALPSCLY